MNRKKDEREGVGDGGEIEKGENRDELREVKGEGKDMVWELDKPPVTGAAEN